MFEPGSGNGAATACPPFCTKVKSFCARDNSFAMSRFYLSEHRLCSLHLGSFGSPFFFAGRASQQSGSRKPALGRFFALLLEQFLQRANSLVNVLLFQKKWRQEADNRVLRAVEQHALGQGSIHNGPGRNFQVYALNKSAAANFFR